MTSVSLEYKVTERDDNKSFACRAENRQTKITRESYIILTVLYPPKWIEGKGVFGGPSGPSREGPGVGHKIVSDTKQMTKEREKKEKK